MAKRKAREARYNSGTERAIHAQGGKLWRCPSTSVPI